MVADFNKKGNKKLFDDQIWFKIGAVLILTFVVFLIFTDVKIYRKKQELNSQIGDYKKQIQEIKSSSQNLKDEIANSDNQAYLEKIAYEQLGEARPGETVYSFIMPKEKEKIDKNKNSWWDLITDWLKSKK